MNMIRATAIAVLAVMLVACSGGGATTAPTTSPTSAATATAAPTATTAPTEAPTEEPTTAPTEEPTSSPSEAPTGSPAAGPVCENLPEGSEGDLLATICERGTILVSTDPNYAPQSFLNPDGTFEGFDIDTANEIGARLGVEVQFETPSFDAVVAGSWSDRWDISVGSVTITEEREEILDFTQAYYYTPAQIAVTTDSGITSIDALAGQPICVGSSTTYQYWLDGTLNLVGSPEPTPPPAGATAFPLGTDQDCAQSVQSGRSDFEAWLSSSTTIQAAIDADTPMVAVGDPVFFEALAVATDKSNADHDALQTALDEIIAAMHADGTLSASSMEWFDGLDLTVTE
ncbi:MAG TPA: transporter substrate-binding domain-containing protein [Candidatus Limnocylindrales bacterium]|nr:transporter substrate-binding domain-containing protein [Candidatus Limnocylindrales bacterium]